MVKLKIPEGYDPLELAKKIEPIVAPRRGKTQLRRYHRFRKDRWYGGIVTGDVVGCNLRCKFCWAYRFTWTNLDKGPLYDPEEVARKLVSMAYKYRVPRARLSGGEPTIGSDHLIEVIDLVTDRGLIFVLETNGILIGANERLAKRLAEFHRRGIEVRVSIKGTSPEEFVMLTGAKPSGWGLQLKALKLLVDYGLEPGEEVYPAVMLSFTDEKGVVRIKNVLKAIHPALASNIDPEYVILYPHVRKLLKMTGLKPRIAYTPDGLPSELI
jgi:uncharacterized Fe-S cluster-containing radical SAM superfamily protein